MIWGGFYHRAFLEGLVGDSRKDFLTLQKKRVDFDIQHRASYDILKIRGRDKILLKWTFGLDFQIAITLKAVRSALCELVNIGVLVLRLR